MKTKKQLVNEVAGKANLSASSVANVLDALSEVVVDTLKDGDPVTLPGLGRMQVKDRAARDFRVPATGAVVHKPAMKTVKMSVSKTVTDQVNG